MPAGRLLRCIAAAAVRRGARALAGVIPFGEVVYDIAAEVYEEYRKERDEADLRGDVVSLAQASSTQVEEAAREATATSPADIQKPLTDYLTQVPVSIRQSLRRPADPTGMTVPANFTLGRPEDLLAVLPTGLPRFRPGDTPLAADWELVELLGKGGFGEVWKARHLYRPTQRPVALKFCLDAVSARALRHEAGLHAVLDQVRQQGRLDGVVPLLETYLRADPPCLMYEYVEGGDLAGLVRDLKAEGRLTPSFAAWAVHRLASVVGRLHRFDPPLVHRDLKPANVLVRASATGPELLVADFGIGGLAAGQALRAADAGAHYRTLPSAVRGAYTPLYASPQQARGGAPAPRDDVYALGVIWFQLLAGDTASGIPADWREVAEEAGVGAGQAALLAACLASREERRPATAAELADRLDPLLLSGDQGSCVTDSSTKQEQVGPIEQARPAPETQPEEGAHRPTLPRILNIPFKGKWWARPADGVRRTRQSGAWGDWRLVRKTPGEVEILDGQEYRLDAEGEGVTDAGLFPLCELPSLVFVSLKQCEAFTDTGVGHLGRLPGLVNLMITDCRQVGELGVAQLGRLAGLKSLSLCSVPGVTDAGTAHLGRLTGLLKLFLEDCPDVTDGGMAFLGGLTSLEGLYLTKLPCVTDAGLAPVRRLTGMKKFSLVEVSALKGDGLAHLAVLNRLKEVTLHRLPRLEDDGLAHLAGMTRLTFLSLIDLPHVTDAGLAHLANLTGLRHLSFRFGPGATATGLAHLHGLTGLKYLDFPDDTPNLTPAVIESLEVAIPGCRVCDVSYAYPLTPAAPVLAKEFVNSIGMKFALIPAGKFLMGSPEDEAGRSEDEGPQHEVVITRPFYLGIYTVTQGEYEWIMGKNPSHFKLGDRHPVEQVSWDDAVEFCLRLSAMPRELESNHLYRLPAEAEWEYACRGPAVSYQPFNLGNSLSSKQANFDCRFPYGGAAKGEYRKRTVPVEEFTPNGWGLYQMHGNVWEWCGDWHEAGYYASSPRQDPQGPPVGSLRVARGGGWYYRGRYCRSAYRSWFEPASRISYLGFRVALVAPPEHISEPTISSASVPAAAFVSAERPLTPTADLADRLTPLLPDEDRLTPNAGPPEETISAVEVAQTVFPRVISIPFQGKWWARPAGGPWRTSPSGGRKGFRLVRKTPGQIELREGEEYSLEAHNEGVTDEGLAAFRELTSLLFLSLQNCDAITPAGVAHLRSYPGLVNLHMAGCSRIGLDGLAQIGKLTGLKSLFLAVAPSLTDVEAAHLAGLTGLLELSLSRQDKITDTGLGFLRGMPKLEKLTLWGIPRLTGSGLSALKDQDGLTSLDIQSDGLTSAGLGAIGQLSETKHLAIRGRDGLTDGGLDAFNSLCLLESLLIEGWGGLIGDGIARLVGLTKLHSVNLYNLPQMSDVGLRYLGEMPRLTGLALWSIPLLTDDGVAHLTRMAELKYLTLESLPQLTDEGLSHVGNLTNLKRLNLYRCPRVTPAGLLRLHTLKNLTLLDLTADIPNLTPAVVETIRSALPNCKVRV